MRLDSRHIKKRSGAGWMDVKAARLRKYDVFRMVEPSGELVVGHMGNIDWVATMDALSREDGGWFVRAIPYRNVTPHGS